MTRKILIALAAAAALTVGFGAQAQAKTTINIDFGVNIPAPAPFYDPGYPAPDYYDAGYDDQQDCGWETVRRVKWNWNHTRRFVRYTKVWVCN
jgi:hypothetical protein